MNRTEGRERAPVFVLGSVRSGTTLLYHMLLSSGGFAVYRTESHVFNVLEPRFGNLGKIQNRRKLMAAWLDSKLFHVSGLDAEDIRQKVLTTVRNGGQFLRTVMEEVARKQAVQRWADCTPEHLLYLRRIKETIPDALIIHIVRDGRDVALSLERQGWIRPLPTDYRRALYASATYWEWVVNRGRVDGRALGGDYCEVRFEDLVANPVGVLQKLGQFIHHDLDYERIQQVAIGSVNQPNTSFDTSAKPQDFNPVGRWREALSPGDLRQLESLIGSTLHAFGYQCETEPRRSANDNFWRRVYLEYFNTKLWAKSETPLGRVFVTKDLSWL